MLAPKTHLTTTHQQPRYHQWPLASSLCCVSPLQLSSHMPQLISSLSIHLTDDDGEPFPSSIQLVVQTLTCKLLDPELRGERPLSLDPDVDLTKYPSVSSSMTNVQVHPELTLVKSLRHARSAQTEAIVLPATVVEAPSACLNPLGHALTTRTCSRRILTKRRSSFVLLAPTSGVQNAR